MGEVNFYAYVVLGCEVTGKLYREIETLTPCSHAGVAQATSKFCPQCGRTQMQTEHRPIDQYNIDDETLNGLKVEWSRLGNTPDNFRAFAGIVVATDEHTQALRMAIPLNELDDHAEIVRKALEEIGLWDADSFGLWAVLDAQPRF